MSTSNNRSRRAFLQAGCGLIASGGAQALFPQLNLIPTALAQVAPGGYKALVCLYLGGGSDNWNLLIPGDVTAHAKYASARNGLYNGTSNTSGLAIPHHSGSGVVAGQTVPASLSIAGGQYGLNPFCPELAQLFNENRLAFLSNIGPVVEPITRATFSARAKPPQLYSHNDQTNLWYIGSASSTQVTEGWGGRVAGNVSVLPVTTQGLPPTITLAGQTRFLLGRASDNSPMFPFTLSTSTTTPATSLNNYSSTSTTANQFQQVRRQYLNELLNTASPQAFTDEYRTIVDRSMDLSLLINNNIVGSPAGVTPVVNGIAASDPVNGGGTTGFAWPSGSLADQLKQVAKMIRISTSRPDDGNYVSPIGANRQVFFVNIGGFDTHDAQITTAGATGHHLLLQRVSQAVNAFYRAMVAIGRHNDVTLFSMSEFGRTINSNGNGSDHAWGSVQFAVGGAVNGGAVYGRYPTVVLNNQLTGTVSDNATQGECFSRGQFIPTTAVDQLGSTLARWMGVADSTLPVIFPNIDRFTTGPFANSVSSPTFASFSRIVSGLMQGVS